jgi:hypothetical protein
MAEGGAGSVPATALEEGSAPSGGAARGRRKGAEGEPSGQKRKRACEPSIREPRACISRTDVPSTGSGDARGCARGGACARRALNFPPKMNHAELIRIRTFLHKKGSIHANQNMCSSHRHVLLAGDDGLF